MKVKETVPIKKVRIKTEIEILWEKERMRRKKKETEKKKERKKRKRCGKKEEEKMEERESTNKMVRNYDGNIQLDILKKRLKATKESSRWIETHFDASVSVFAAKSI